VSASFTDPDIGDTHTATWDWGDTTTSGGTVDENQKVITGSHVYTKVGVYPIILTVNDGLVNSDPSSILIEVIVKETKIITDIQNLETTITALSSNLLKNANMQNTLNNKLNAVIADVNSADYTAAINKLQNDILAKTDGCAISGAPDKNDWITDCKTQATLYPQIQSIINQIKGL
jgi:hypothetical protein